MLALSKTLLPKLAAPTSVGLINSNFTRAKSSPSSMGTVPIFRIAPEVPFTNLTMGPYPRTQEERERAAKKYNLIPEDYEPYDEDHGWGDYPNLKPIGAFNRDRYDDYDDPVDLRFHGEVYQLAYDSHLWERIDPLRKEKAKYEYPWWKGALFFFGLAAVMPIIRLIEHPYKLYLNNPWKAREFGEPIYEFPQSDHHRHGHH